MGDFREEFSRLYDYAEQIKTTNPETTVSIRTSKNTISGKEVFMSIYICLGSLKSGCKEGCRRIIGLDGAFLKGLCKGKLLTCIFKDENNHMYPIAWAVVDKETKETWSWFFKCIRHNLELKEGEGLTVMSDMQKGLHLALIDVLPNAEIRWLVRHTWANWKKDWRGEERRRKLWKVVGHHLSWIVGARLKSIITMLEEIRVKVMESMNQMREFSEKWITDVSPMAMDILRRNAEIADNCEIRFNGDIGFEINDSPYKHVVDLKKKIYSTYDKHEDVAKK
ncbi:uncharacterized protein LOC107001499 [Solanum pennellii]|uniref:Uncharacterized protein LOC107001499 n=1 Tax=Solanum pennellii TaxID=28526 RepID=A0ABM1UWS9_SOLPN|nr:uncharacterized protein LOC107001499 [Solanum pennellii]